MANWFFGGIEIEDNAAQIEYLEPLGAVNYRLLGTGRIRYVPRLSQTPKVGEKYRIRCRWELAPLALLNRLQLFYKFNRTFTATIQQFDQGTAAADQAKTYSESGQLYWLPHSPVRSVGSTTIYRDGLALPSGWTMETTSGRVRFTSTTTGEITASYEWMPTLAIDDLVPREVWNKPFLFEIDAEMSEV